MLTCTEKSGEKRKLFCENGKLNTGKLNTGKLKKGKLNKGKLKSGKDIQSILFI